MGSLESGKIVSYFSVGVENRPPRGPSIVGKFLIDIVSDAWVKRGLIYQRGLNIVSSAELNPMGGIW